MTYDIAIQIVNYNTRSYLEKCVESVVKDVSNSKFNWKILVLDNNSDDDLSDLKERWHKHDISFYKADENFGFGAGHNFLAKQASSKYLLILNPDIELIEKSTTERLLDEFRLDKKVKVVGPKLVNAKGKSQRHDHGELYGVIARVLNRFGSSFWSNQDRRTLCTWVSGAVLMMEREVFEKLDGFDEAFFLYREEEDLCLRLRQLEYFVVYQPSIKVLHYNSVVAKKSEHFRKSNEYFLKKHVKGRIVYSFAIAINWVWWGVRGI